MFQRPGDHISINTTEQEVPPKPMSGNNIKFPSHSCVCGRGKKSDKENEDAPNRKTYEINPIIAWNCQGGSWRKGEGGKPGRCCDPGELLLAAARPRERSKNTRAEEEHEFTAAWRLMHQRLTWSGRLVTGWAPTVCKKIPKKHILPVLGRAPLFSCSL